MNVLPYYCTVTEIPVQAETHVDDVLMIDHVDHLPIDDLRVIRALWPGDDSMFLDWTYLSRRSVPSP